MMKLLLIWENNAVIIEEKQFVSCYIAIRDAGYHGEITSSEVQELS